MQILQSPEKARDAESKVDLDFDNMFAIQKVSSLVSQKKQFNMKQYLILIVIGI